MAHYEYSPFGTQTAASGTYAATNPFRFSSEYYDTQAGLVYYNYRYYDSKLGRLVSRDPIGEYGGENLYNFLSNMTIVSFDELGWGKFVVEKKTIQNDHPKASDEFVAMGNPDGFSVSWMPSTNDKKKCQCGNIYLSQSISSTGSFWATLFRGKKSHVDANEKEKIRHRESNYSLPPPKMTPVGKRKYSYIDSPLPFRYPILSRHQAFVKKEKEYFSKNYLLF